MIYYNILEKIHCYYEKKHIVDVKLGLTFRGNTKLGIHMLDELWMCCPEK